jgi:hypothetical protein
MTVTAVRKDHKTFTMTAEAEFDASPERVWQLWADPRQLEPRDRRGVDGQRPGGCQLKRRRRGKTGRRGQRRAQRVVALRWRRH